MGVKGVKGVKEIKHVKHEVRGVCMHQHSQ